MAINPHHTIEELNGIRCSVVEKNISDERASYLKSILEVNGMIVQVIKNENGSNTIGVTDLLFNPVHAVYNRSLKTPEGKIMTPAYWLQKKQDDEYYWNYK